MIKIHKILLGLIIIFNCFFAVAAQGSEISSLNVQHDWTDFNVYWDRVNLDQNQSIVVIRKEGSCPENLNDGSEIYRGNGSSYRDTQILADHQYCYGAFVSGVNGLTSRMVTSSVVEHDELLNWFSPRIYSFYGLLFVSIILIVILFINWRLYKKRKALRKFRYYRFQRRRRGGVRWKKRMSNKKYFSKRNPNNQKKFQPVGN